MDKIEEITIEQQKQTRIQRYTLLNECMRTYMDIVGNLKQGIISPDTAKELLKQIRYSILFNRLGLDTEYDDAEFGEPLLKQVENTISQISQGKARE